MSEDVMTTLQKEGGCGKAEHFKKMVYKSDFFRQVFRLGFFTHDVMCVNLTLATLVPTFFVLISHFLTLAQLWQVIQV